MADAAVNRAIASHDKGTGLVSGSAHDFSNLLGVIIGNLDLLSEQPGLDAQAKDIAHEALTAALRASELVEQLTVRKNAPR